jgi:hypothetical protein
MRSIFTPLLVLAGFTVFGQTISVTKVELSGKKVIVYYDLDDNNPNNEYLLNLYASKDNYAAALTKVNGDVGPEIKPGTGKKIEWSITEEYGEYAGKLALEVRGRVYVPFVKLQNFNTAKVYKRGKSYDLAWKPGNSNPINIELYKGGQRIDGNVNHPNNGAFTLFIPAHAKKGNDYRLKISDAKNSEEVIYTDLFKVRHKIPLVVKAGLPLVVAGVIIAILPKGDDGGDKKTDNGNEIPIPNLPGN